MEPVRQVLSRRHGASRPCGLGLRCECLASLITGTFDFFSAKETLINSAWRSSLTRPRAL
ncbi:hypothetical protein A8D88_20125 [Burkholderia cenocepacia]|nr:hypothetical protein A8D88_20125 [Burkholderia cenocepacia]ONQ28168.1 hypothetical protein A8D98_26045 [Burkholderia cenocepacia]